MTAALDKLPPPVIDQKPRCWKCDRVLMAYAARPWCIRCKRCKMVNKSREE